ncbi:MAG TPA: inositol monophosphatase family protein [Armatimonadota bacterium]|jgi:myo-inositol-1(or 4)-monophosphatase
MSDYLAVAIDAARQSGQIQREGLHQPIAIREETQHDIKLQTDVDCENRIREILLNAFPDHAILGEEGGGTVDPAVLTWIVDPLDGTVNYARRLPHFCTSIALYQDGEPLVGVVYDPIKEELFTAEAGHGAFLNGERLTVSPVAQLDEAVLAMGFAKSVDTLRAMLHEMHDMVHAVRKVRIFGAAALDLSYVAAGRLDGFIEYGLQSWDIAAGTLLIREAGGRVQLTPVGKAWDVRADNGRLL